MIIRYGKNLRKDKSVNLTAKKPGEISDITVQTLRFQYINFLAKAIENAESNNLPAAKDSEV